MHNGARGYLLEQIFARAKDFLRTIRMIQSDAKNAKKEKIKISYGHLKII